MRLSILFVTLLALPLWGSAAHGDDQTSGEEARAAYETAQMHKRNNRFAEARQTFAQVSELAGPSALQWAQLAADELRYGLPLHEAGVLTAQLGQAADFPNRRRILERLDALYRDLLDNNADKPERIGEIERRRDQLALLHQAVRSGEQASTGRHLELLRQRIEDFRVQTGQWPDRRRFQQELSQALQDAGLAADRLDIVNFYPSSSLLHVTLRDSQTGADIKLNGDGRGVRLGQ